MAYVTFVEYADPLSFGHVQDEPWKLTRDARDLWSGHEWETAKAGHSSLFSGKIAEEEPSTG